MQVESFDHFFSNVVGNNCAGPAPQEGGGEFRGRTSPNENCALLSEDCAPKKLTCSGLLECKSRSKTPKLVFTALEFVSKNCFFVIFVELHRTSLNFWDEDLFFVGLHFRVRGKSQEF